MRRSAFARYAPASTSISAVRSVSDLLGLAERGFASLDRFGEDVGPLHQ
jgi:hypothetical protein